MNRLESLEYVSVAETKAKLSEKINRVDQNGRAFAITSHGRPKAVLISYKEYCALVDDSQTTQKTIDIGKWNKEKNDREKIVLSVSNLFDANKLEKKGQKRYKQNAVGKLQKIK